MSAANKITLLRIVLIPLLLAFMVPDSVIDRWIALAIFLLASATDWLDGYVARSRRQVTPLGKLLDPVADKLLVTAALLPLVRKELVSDYMAALLIGREFLVSGLRSVASAEGSGGRRARIPESRRSSDSGENRLGVPPPMKRLARRRPHTHGNACSRSASSLSMYAASGRAPWRSCELKSQYGHLRTHQGMWT